MNSLEDRVRAAVQATAAEIAPDDVPPMRPLGAGSGGSRRRTGRGSGGARGAAWRWGAPLAAAAAVLAVVAAASLLAGVLPSHAPGPAAARPSKPAHRTDATASYPPNLQAGLIGFFLPASGAQFTTGALFMGEYTALEEKISSACMAGHGYLVPVATPAEIARPVWDLTQFPDLGAIARAGALPSYSVGPAPRESEAYQQAAQHCDALSRVPFTSMRGASASLVNSWLPIVTTRPALRSPRFRDQLVRRLRRLGGRPSRRGRQPGRVGGPAERAGPPLGRGVRGVRAADRRGHGEVAASRAADVPARAPAAVRGAGRDRPRGLRPGRTARWSVTAERLGQPPGGLAPGHLRVDH